MTTYDRYKMKNITIALPDEMVYAIDTLQEQGDFPSRSEGLRIAIEDYIKQETKLQACLPRRA